MWNKVSFRTTKAGFGLIEIVIVGALVALIMVPVVQVSIHSLQLRTQTLRNTQAVFLGIEGLEAMRLIRDSGWATTSALALNTDHYLSWDGVAWRIVPGTEPALIDGLFERKIRLLPVHRDANHLIIATGGSPDPDARTVEVSVSWNSRFGVSKKTVSAYLFNLFP